MKDIEALNQQLARLVELAACLREDKALSGGQARGLQANVT